MEQYMVRDGVLKKWNPIIENKSVPAIKDSHRKRCVAQILENTQAERINPTDPDAAAFLAETSSLVPVNFMGASSSTAGAGGVDIFDPILVSMLRRTMPNLIAYDIGGVQPMKGPTGLIFALRSRYVDQSGTETFYNEVNTAFSTVVSGANTLGQKHAGTLPGDPTTGYANLAANGTYNYGTGVSTAQLEALGTDSNSAIPKMSFTIEKTTATAVGRALMADYTIEIAQDLKAVHGLDADPLLSEILTGEVLAEINREFVRLINVTAKQGSQVDTVTPGVFDLDTDSSGRWSVEKFKGLIFHIGRECNVIAKETRRGRGNILLCSSDVAEALNAAGKLDYTPALQGNDLQVDDTGNTFAGLLNGRIKVYIDPYAIGGNYFTVGYRGANPLDAGIFYCPYVPLQKLRATDQGSFSPKIAYKTRYAMVANPFAEGLTKGSGVPHVDSNVYYRRTIVTHLL